LVLSFAEVTPSDHPPLIAEDIRFNAIAIAESLDRGARTGKILLEYLVGLIAETDLPIATIYEDCSSADAFREFVRNLTTRARRDGLLPMLHIEAHGSLDEGIYFADDSMLTWPELCELIRPLNIATSFQLTVVVAACFGISVVMGVSLKEPAPCFAMIGPSDEIDPGEVLASYRSMYGAMLKSLDATQVVAAMETTKPARGGIVLMSAQRWFELLMMQYLEKHADAKSRKEAAMRQYCELRASGGSADLGDLKRRIKANLPQVVRRYFEAYFGYEVVPNNGARFERLWPPYEAKIAAAK
jgi:hypothetical protein